MGIEIVCAPQKNTVGIIGKWFSRELEKILDFSTLHLEISAQNGKLLIDNIKISVEIEGKNLCGDPGFDGAFGVDHWYDQNEGEDWDNLKLKTSNGLSEYSKRKFSSKGNSLHLKNTATYKSARYSYQGEPLVFSGWTRFKNIKRGVKPWAYSGVQLVVYDDEDKVIGHRDVTTLKPGSMDWTYFSTFIPPGAFRKNASYIELWLRNFEGVSGESWFDEISLVKIASWTVK